MILGTAGHVDHGKTALTRALTGVDTDRLAEERRRGLTIELGFAPLLLPGGRLVSVVDVPGHEKFVPTMLSGAAGMDSVLLTVAADEGVMPQTLEHLGILHLLGVPSGILVITKCDLAGPARIAQVEEQIRAAAAGTFLAQAPCLAVSARTGAGLEELRRAIARLPEPRREPDIPFVLHIDRVFTAPGSGLIVTGTAASGSISQGDRVEIAPAGLTARVRGLQRHGQSLSRIEAGSRAAVNLTGVRSEQIRRGDTLCTPGSLVLTRQADVSLTLLPNAPFSVINNSQLHLHHGARSLVCRCILLGYDRLEPGQSGFAQLRLPAPLAARPGDPFVVRFFSPVATVGGGVLLNLSPPRRGRQEPGRLAGLAARASGDPAVRAARLLEETGDVPLPLEALCRDARISPSQLSCPREGGFCLSAAALDRLEGRTRALLEQSPGLSRGELLHRLFPGGGAGGAAFLPRLLAAHRVENAGGKLYLPGTAPRPQSGAAAALEALYLDFALSPPDNAGVEAAFPAGVSACRQSARALLDSGVLVALSPRYRLHAGVYRRSVAALYAAFGEAPFTLAQARDALGVSRKYALLLLEYLDRRGVTRPAGEGRRFARPPEG